MKTLKTSRKYLSNHKKKLLNQFTWTGTGPWIANLSLIWPGKPKEFPIPGLVTLILRECLKVEKLFQNLFRVIKKVLKNS